MVSTKPQTTSSGGQPISYAYQVCDKYWKDDGYREVIATYTGTGVAVWLALSDGGNGCMAGEQAIFEKVTAEKATVEKQLLKQATVERATVEKATAEKQRLKQATVEKATVEKATAANIPVQRLWGKALLCTTVNK
eukprot:3381719-Rhodomonas_salina.1